MDLLLVGLLSATVLALEIVWTRIFAAEYFYTFAFLILSLAILGLGLGALSLRLWSRLAERRSLPALLTAATAFALAGPTLVLRLELDLGTLVSSWATVGKFLLALALVSAPFVLGGAVLANVFRRLHRDMPRLYMADLLGAGMGIVLGIALMNTAGTAQASFLVCVPALAAAVLVSRKARGAQALLVVATVVAVVQADPLLSPPREERAPVLSTHWDAMGKIKILGFSDDYHGINIDNAANSPVWHFDGNWDKPDSMLFEFPIHVKTLLEHSGGRTFLSLGSGGGTDVIQALQEGCTEIHAVEVNGAINRMMTEGDLHEFSGRIYDDPRVKVVTEDARAYVRRFEDHFDVIFSLSSNSFAALASGSFALAEDYLFTTEAFEDYYRALSPNGFLSMEHQFYMPKLVSEALAALTNLGVENPRDHIAVYDLPQMRRNLLLMSKQPLTEELRQNAYGPLTPERYASFHLLYPAPDSTANDLIHRIVESGWRNEAAGAPVDIRPNDDDRPFTAQLGRWSNVDFGAMEKLTPYEFRGFPVSRLILLAILAIILVVCLPLLALPRLVSRTRLPVAGWGYFFAIGVAYMAVEVMLLTRYTLFIGASAYTFATIVLALLVGSGVGSRFSWRFGDTLPFVAIAVWLLLEIVAFRPLTGALTGLPMAGRMAVSAGLLLPLGFFMGMPFPKGARRLGDLMDWGFAVNGVASVLGATGILLVAFSEGTSAALRLATLVYLGALLLLRSERGWVARRQPVSEAAAPDRPEAISTL